jgi:hypothetical protein
LDVTINGFQGFQGPGYSPKTFLTLTDGATINWTYSIAYNAKVTIAGSRTLSIVGATNGDYGTLVVIQDGTGGRRLNLTGKFPGGTYSFTSTANAQDIFTWVYDGVTYYWNYNKNFS